MKFSHPSSLFLATVATILVASAAAHASDGLAHPTANWPMFRGNPALTGVASGSLPDKLSLLWSFQSGGPVKSSASIVDGRVFIGSGDSNVYALDLTSGKKIWAAKTGGPFFGSTDNSLYAVEAASGKPVWKYETGDKILGSPNWFVQPLTRPSDTLSPSDGERAGVRGALKTNIVVGSYDFKLHCLDAATGKTNWVYETGNYINGSPAVFEGKTAFGGCDAILHVLSLDKGEKVKEIEAGAYIAASVAVVDNRAYFGHYENEFLCIDLDKGERAWTFKDREFPYFSSPAVTKDRVVFGGRDKRLHCVKRDNGENVWAFATQGKVDSSPVVAGDKAVVGSDDGRLYVVSMTTGKQLWSYEIGKPIGSSPAVVNGKVVVGSDDGSVYCFGGK